MIICVSPCFKQNNFVVIYCCVFILTFVFNNVLLYMFYFSLVWFSCSRDFFCKISKSRTDHFYGASDSGSIIYRRIN